MPLALAVWRRLVLGLLLFLLLAAGPLPTAADLASPRAGQLAARKARGLAKLDKAVAGGAAIWRSLASAKREAAPLAAGDKVLIFWAVGAKKNTVELVKKNVQRARQQLSRVSIFLSHYDHQKTLFQMLAGHEWYKENVDGSVEETGYKFQMLKSLVNSSSIKLRDYDWVWALDEDANFQFTPLPRMLKLARESGAWITTPAFKDRETGSTEMDMPFQAPRPECRYRYLPVVEVTFPLFRAEALQLLMTDCEHCMHRRTGWGFCRMWCAYSAKKLGTERDTACAVLDGAPMVHDDFKTLHGKYKKPTEAGKQRLRGLLKHLDTYKSSNELMEVDSQHPGSAAFQEVAMQDYRDVEAHHPGEFVLEPGRLIRTLSCVPARESRGNASSLTAP